MFTKELTVFEKRVNWHYCCIEDFIQSLNGLKTELHATNKSVGDRADSCLTQLPNNKRHASNEKSGDGRQAKSRALSKARD